MSGERNSTSSVRLVTMTGALFATSVALNAGAAQTAAAEATELEEVQVTASRIQRSGFEAPTPTTMVGAEEIEARAAPRISQILFDIPAMRPTATSIPFSALAGATFANLRNLNPAGGGGSTATRTLVLVDGRRVVSSSTTGLVDLNSIPTSLVERVEVVTGGASAAWGSDAVAGVTNFILKKKIEGLQGNVQVGQSQRGDAKERNVSLAWGQGYAGGKGQVMMAFEYSHQSDMPTVGDRSWGRDQWGWVTGTYNGITVNRIATTGVVASGVAAGGVIVATNGTPLPTTGPTSALRGIQFDANGNPVPFVYGTFLSSNQMVGGSGPSQSQLLYLGAPVDRRNYYLRTTYDFSSDVQGFAEYSYAHSESLASTQPNYIPNGNPVLTIQRDNAYLPASIRATMVSNNLTSFGLGRLLYEFGTYGLGASASDTRRFAAGFDGKLGDSASWKFAIGSGKTHYYDSVPNNIREPNLRAAVDTVIGPGGTPICRINSTVASDIAIVNATNYQGRNASPGCVPANPFGAGSISLQAVNYIMGTSYTMADIQQDSATGSLQAEPFSTWADKVSVAAGFDFRRDTVNQMADPTAMTTSAAFQTGAWQYANRRPLDGAVEVKEVFGETVVPLAKGITGIKSLDLNAAIRGTDYSTSGNVTSWKLGLAYAPVGGLLVRATKSRDIRAANLVELYTPGLSTVGAIVDYGRAGNPSASVPNTTLGNPNLKPEKADTLTFGVSWQPEGSGFKASVDWYQIKLNDAIGSLGAQNIVNACYGVAPFTTANAQYCSLISRDSTGLISNVSNATLNLAFTKTSGTDIELSYQIRQALTLRLLATHLSSIIVNNGIVTVDRAGEVGNSRWRLNASATWNRGPLSLNLQGRYVQSALIDVTYGPADISNNNVPSRVYLNGGAQYTIRQSDSGQLLAFLNVNNLLDQNPPIVPSASAAPSQAPLGVDYDKIGRYFTTGLRFKF